MKTVVDVSNLTKRFGKLLAVDNLSLSIKEGEIVGLLGPNGAGKTTTIMMLLGLIKPDKGKIKILGKRMPENRGEILARASFASSELRMQARLSVAENLLVYSYLYSLENKKEKIEGVLRDLEIENLARKRFHLLSSGEKTKAILAKALLCRPRLLFLDEPTASLDPYMANKVRNLLLHIKKKFAVTMLYTSHNMSEVTKMCDKVIFLSQGKIIAGGTPLELTRKIKDSNLAAKPDLEEVFIRIAKEQ
jgi:ABC-2 type transport system ATP-binding protein